MERRGFRRLRLPRPLSVILTLQMQVDGGGVGRVPFPSCELRQARQLQGEAFRGNEGLQLRHEM